MPQRRDPAPDAVERRRSRDRRRSRSRCPGRSASTRPHGSMISERPPARWPGGWAPIWLGAITKHWFSIARARSSTSQWSRVVASVNAAGTEQHLRTAHGEHPVQLGEADVVADAHPQAYAAGQLRDDDLVARVLGARTRRRRRRRPRRRTCGACGTRRGSRRRRRRGRWCWPPCPARRRARRSIRRRDRSRARARSIAPTRCSAPSSGSAAPAVICSSVPSTLHFSGSTTSSAPSAAASRTRRSAVSRFRSVSSVALS